ncbi:hypothetical protein ACIQNU_04305 [Streptomyces sp. NPDC091292]|uniref:hypothetical protein n=1 Tax=Streptomyces sp. NPDC091292 TaxID=3365991 RepID=UPI00382C8D7F
MQTFELAATVVAGTALVLAPIDLHPVRPTEPLPVDAQYAIARIEHKLAAPDREKVAAVRQALGFRYGWTPAPHLGETPTYITAWTQHELNDMYEQVGGIVTTRIVERSPYGCDTTWKATEITLTVDVPGVGYVEIVTDWDEDSGGRDLPIMQVIPDAILIAN